MQSFLKVADCRHRLVTARKGFPECRLCALTSRLSVDCSNHILFKLTLRNEYSRSLIFATRVR